MYNRTLMMMLAVLGATAGLAMYAATANAVVVDNNFFILDSEEDDYLDGNVAFDWSNGEVTPTTTGVLRIENGDDTCARVVVDHYNDEVLLGSDPGNAMCVTDDLVHEWNSNRHHFSDPLIDRVVVRVEKQTVSGWSTQAERELDMSVFADLASVYRPGIDIGDDSWNGTRPTFPAMLDWSIEEGIAEGEFVGSLHLDNSSGVCGRIKIRFLTESGGFLDSAKSDQECAPDNGHHDWPVNLAYSSNLLGKAEIIAQTRAGGQWNDAGSTTVSIEA